MSSEGAVATLVTESEVGELLSVLLNLCILSTRPAQNSCLKYHSISFFLGTTTLRVYKVNRHGLRRDRCSR